MKEHFCPAEKTTITYQDKCNWCGEKETLAQTQEPVGQLLEEAYGRGQVMWFNKPKDQSMLYTTPPQRTWVGLTEREQGAMMEDLNAHGTNIYNFAKAIESKLKQKNGFAEEKNNGV